MNRGVLRVLLGGVLVTAVMSVSAQNAGEWTVRAGYWNVAPKSDNSDVVNVDAGQSLGFNLTYMLTDRWGVELLASLPFTHDINLNAGGDVGETKHLPPTLSAQYHFPLGQNSSVYGGLGLNYTLFFEERTRNALAGTNLELDNSLGLAAQAGLDYRFNENYLLNVDVRWADIDTDASLDGADLGTVEIDPVVIGVNLGFRF